MNCELRVHSYAATSTRKPDLKYHHLGIPTRDKLRDEKHLKHLKMYVSGYGASLYGVEWTRYEDDAPYPELVKTVPHIAFEVDNIQEVIDGKNVIIEPNSPSPGVIVAFIEDNGAPIEFLEIDRSIAEDGI
jgi:hypothetical protein